MEIDSSPLRLNESEVVVGAKKVSRNNSRGVRVVGSRIYDSENGKSCHQCRQKTMDFSASCKNPKNGKPCTIRFCHKCLLNRYGEKAEEVDLLSDWMCPKCKGSCNCSICMKRKGQQPTGLLVYTAKASGFKSVSEMLSKKASHGLDKELVVHLFEEPWKENSLGRNKVENEKTKKMKRRKLKEISNGNNVDAACQKKTSKRKRCNGVPEDEVKRNKNSYWQHAPPQGVVCLFFLV
ncbi:unnamed protein product [Vicia faba]|uniref:Zinc-finger domain-containing protein n=1 Tax=Vicia faba TaxID=3906 RepID=A0AAV1AK71_VICFA|nr:unnamed protein product [Vicia faba]